ncbi:hypothetical protein IFM89_025621 [Coptis chinensis]|uniref:Reverse transcriptase zinc-binding domain-containing protein n=1 Tax=Coptis chinensis TaxID=261450 RepID=A0A835H5X2_9MAGN|nr:hypothetical protein IFM89_025621 [Coptis chinensis]
MALTDDTLKGCRSKLAQIIVNGDWKMPTEVQQVLDQANVARLPPCYPSELDELIQTPDIRGKFSVASAFEQIREKETQVGWDTLVWNASIHPSTSATAWKSFNNCAATDTSIRKKGVHLASKCCCGCKEEEDLDHILWHCQFAKNLWSWNAELYGLEDNFQNALEARAKTMGRSPLIRKLWDACIVNSMVILWKHRNMVVYDNKAPDNATCKRMTPMGKTTYHGSYRLGGTNAKRSCKPFG